MGERCVAIFDHAFGKLRDTDSVELVRHPAFLALDDYDIALTGPPGGVAGMAEARCRAGCWCPGRTAARTDADGPLEVELLGHAALPVRIGPNPATLVVQRFHVRHRGSRHLETA